MAHDNPAAWFQSVSDPSRLRLLRLLDLQELNVQELVAITGLSQPRVSKHLAILRDQGWLKMRREGTWSWHRTVEPAGFRGGGELFVQVLLAAQQVAEATGDDAGLAAVMAERQARDRDFFAMVADRWDQVRRCYEHPDLRLGMLGGLVAPGTRVLEIGTGIGAMLPVFAETAAHTVALDSSAAMLDRARLLCREQALANVAFCRADVLELPFLSAVFDACNCAMVLHHVAQPRQAVAEMARVIRPGGRLTLTAFCSHRQEWMRQELAHQWLGFTREQAEDFFARAGLRIARYLQRAPQAEEAGNRGGILPEKLTMPDAFQLTGIKD